MALDYSQKLETLKVFRNLVQHLYFLLLTREYFF